MSDYVIRHKGTPFTLLQQVERSLSAQLIEAKNLPNNYLNPEIPHSEAEFLSKTLLPLIRQYLIIAENNPDSQLLLNIVKQYDQKQPQPQSNPWRHNSKLHR